MQYKIFISCRLYSWMRFVITSNRKCSGISIPCVFLMYAERRRLACRRASSHDDCSEGSDARERKWVRRSSWVTQLSVCSASVMTFDKSMSYSQCWLNLQGLHCSNHRLGVIPLVIFFSFWGSSIWNIENTCDCRILVCNCETPLTVWDPMIARLAIRIRFSSSLEKIDVRSIISNRRGSVLNCVWSWSIKFQLISKIIWVILHRYSHHNQLWVWHTMATTSASYSVARFLRLHSSQYDWYTQSIS